jgi:hypothetical protein
MNEEQQPKLDAGCQKRKTIKIRVPPKPSAPRHSIATVLPKPGWSQSIPHPVMHVLPSSKQAWSDLLLFPFKAYMLMAPIGLVLWQEVTIKHWIGSPLADALERIVSGYAVCGIVFLIAAVIRIATRHRERLGEDLFLAAVAFAVTCLLYSWYVIP